VTVYQTSAPAVRAPTSWWRDAIGVVVAATMLVVLALWVHGRGLQDLVPHASASTGPALTSLGRLTGLVAADLLLLLVLLMARIPVVERLYGRGTLARWHRLVGFTSINLMLAHIVLITLGYAAQAHSGILGEFWTLVTTYPGMLLALFASAALVLVAVTSMRAARRRLRYESWHLLHLYAYLGVGLAIPHQLWTGTEFASSPAATVYWWTFYSLSMAAILGYRLGLPVYRTLRHRMRVEWVVAEGPGVWSVWLTGRALDRLPVRAGQFFNWRFLTGRGWTRAHPYSLSAAPHPGRLRITVKALGDDSALVRRLRPGVRVAVEGPYGNLTGERRRRSRVTMIASGIGVTPLRALLEELPYRPGHATLIYRARTGADFTFRQELEELARRRGIRLFLLPGSRALAGSRADWATRNLSDATVQWAPNGYGDGVALLHRLVPDLVRHDIYVCGPDGWMTSVCRAARALGVPDEQLHTEEFTW
jgi:predicted ferric reductase